MSLGRLGGVYVLLHASHEIADHWVQRHHQALRKGAPDGDGRRACAAHVVALTATQAFALAAGARMVGEHLNARRVAAGLAVNAASHYWADRRTTLARLADATGKGEFYRLGDSKAAPTGTGAYALDQAWHTAWLAVTAAIITGRNPTRP